MAGVRLDLHVHSHHSPDSSLSLDAIASRVAAVGLNGFALTDHNTVAGHRELAACQGRFPSLLLVPGVEVSTAEGHVLAYGVSEAPPVAKPVTETIDWIRDHGGIPVLSHPFRLSHGVGHVLAETAPVAAIETMNGHNRSRANRKASAVSDRRSLPSTGGSDVHEISDVGRAFTEFPTDTLSVDAVLRAMREGRMTARGRSLGPSEWLRTECRTAFLRLRRGFRSI